MVKKWLRNWFWFKKNWFLNKTARRLLFTPGGTVHRLVHGSASARTRFGHGLAEIWFRHFIEHLVCTGTVAVAISFCPSNADGVRIVVWYSRSGISSSSWWASAVSEVLGRDPGVSGMCRWLPRSVSG